MFATQGSWALGLLLSFSLMPGASVIVAVKGSLVRKYCGPFWSSNPSETVLPFALEVNRCIHLQA